jgi:hypothetical protein
MRTIVAFLVISLAAAAQVPTETERVEKRLLDHPDDKGALQRILANPSLAPNKLRADRRELILWLIAHQPESKFFDEPFAQLWPRGKLADPDGFSQAAQLWKDQAAKPGATPKAIANAATFLKMSDPFQGIAILDAAASEHPGDPDLARARGILNAALMVGVSGLDDNNFPRYTTNAARRATRSAANARKEIEGSQDANLVGGAGDFLSHPASLALPFNVTFGDDDVLALAEKWLRRARDLSPGSDVWNSSLSNAIHMRAQRTNDAAEKLRLLLESSNLLPGDQRLNLRAEIALAEFEASDDAGAEREARALVASTTSFHDYHIGQTVLGRIALAKGREAEAREHLLASVKPLAPFRNPATQPNMTLAQEIYDSGDRDTVVAFLEASRAVWGYDQGRLDHMINFVKRSSTPLDLQQMSFRLPGNDFRNRPAPDFEIKDRDGHSRSRDQLSGKVVALVFGTEPAADKLTEKLTKDFSSRGVEFFHATASREDPLARIFEIETDPTLVVIDRKGRVVSYFPGKSNEPAWRREIESGLSGPAFPAPNTVGIPEPKTATIDGSKAAVAWNEVDNAESYVVEWDSRDQQGWIFDREGTVRVIPTRETSAMIDLKGLTRVRWRVFAVPRFGQGGRPSAWREIEGFPVTKIYK